MACLHQKHNKGWSSKNKSLMIIKLKDGILDEMITTANTRRICSQNISTADYRWLNANAKSHLIDFDLGLMFGVVGRRAACIMTHSFWHKYRRNFINFSAFPTRHARVKNFVVRSARCLGKRSRKAGKCCTRIYIKYLTSTDFKTINPSIYAKSLVIVLSQD